LGCWDVDCWTRGQNWRDRLVSSSIDASTELVAQATAHVRVFMVALARNKQHPIILVSP
jgi:hypothetical protein